MASFSSTCGQTPASPRGVTLALSRLAQPPLSCRDHAAPPPSSANDNKCNAKPTRRYAFDIYRAAPGALDWAGSPDADEAMQAAAVEFGTEAWKLIVVPSYEILE
jgi:hypothetical protein